MPTQAGADFLYIDDALVREIGGRGDSRRLDLGREERHSALNAFVPAGWTIESAIRISNEGLILAQGSFNGGAEEYVELSSNTPEPGTILLACGGLLLLTAAMRARRRLTSLT